MSKILTNVFLTVALAVVCVTVLFFFNRAAAPHEKVLPVEGAVLPDYNAIMSVVTEDVLRKDLDALCASPSRFSGTKGCEETADYIESNLRGLGYDVLEQRFSMTVPITRYARILDESGRELEGIRIYPLLPNWFRTATTPPDGLSGKVYQGEKGLAREFQGADLQGNFVLLPLGVSWITVAGMGAGAILYYDDGREIIGARWGHQVNASLNVPRFLVTGDVSALKGKNVTIAARVDFAERPVRNIIAMLKASDSEEAIIVDTYYDSYSYTPDLAPGADQACSAAVFLSIARFLAHEAGELKRTVILVAAPGHGQGLFGIREFIRALGTREERPKALKEAVAAEAELAAELEIANKALAVAKDSSFWSACGNEAETAYWDSKDKKLQEYFTALLIIALDEDLMEAIEAVTQCRVEWIRDDMAIRNAEGGEARSFKAYNEARTRRQLVQAIIATPSGRMKEQWGEYLSAHDVPRRTVEKCRETIDIVTHSLSEASDRVELARALAGYKRALFLGLDLTSRSSRVGVICGDELSAAQCMPADMEIVTQLRNAGEGLNETASSSAIYLKTKRGLPRIVNLLRGHDVMDLDFISSWSASRVYFESSAVLWAGHMAFTLVTLDDGRRRLGTPNDTLDKVVNPAEEDLSESDDKPLENLCVTARLMTGMISQFARGHGRIVPLSSASDLYTIRGQVVSQIGQNLTPDHAMPGAIIRFPRSFLTGPAQMPPGAGGEICLTADRVGRFDLPVIWSRALAWGPRSPIDIDAAMVRPEDGQITWTLSMQKSGPMAPYSVRGIKISQYNKTLAMPVLFRATSVQVVPMSDPATLEPYAGVNFIETKGMAVPQEFNVERTGGAYVCFVPPDTHLYFTFKKGKITNPNLMEIRAFALGATGPADGSGEESESEIFGQGYFAVDSPSVINIELDAALSMAQVNARRMNLQKRYNMVDEMMSDYNRKAIDLADKSQNLADDGKIVPARHIASESLAYSSNIHPVIRKNASDAIVGILFYLLLAIPFAIFMEKLLVGHPDLRFQILYQGIIFILFFIALRAVHPAYELVRSPYMILLGFISFALAAMVSIFVAGRFSTNIGELTQRFQKRTEVVDVSRLGAAMTAFLLGMGHMRKRPVRTGLTVGILVLTTFVMLCFTSVGTDLVDVAFPLGKASYTGLLIRDRNLRNVSAALAPVRELYGEDHIVARRDWAGNFAEGGASELAEYTIICDVGERSYEAKANAILGLTHLEPRVTHITNAFEILNRWFESDSEYSCFLSRALADELRVDDAGVESNVARVSMGGEDYAVLGVFDGNRLSEILDLDEQSLLPIDILSLRMLGWQGAGGQADAGEATDVPEDTPRLPGRSVVITPVDAMPTRNLTASIAIAFQGLDYAGAWKLITSHLERSARLAYYGLDGIAFYGGKFRMQSLEGFLELLIPIIIAALTVLNTMRGSVFERKDELYVFNAVGLSPTHIRSLFLAEASVYAVVGAVGGYLLAQGVAASLRFFGVTAGLSMNYSSMSCVFVSVVIMGVVFVSSIFPARMAARLAAPAEIMTRERHVATTDIIEIDLPFTFNKRDRVAIIPYFFDWFDDFGEGSAGEFFCSPPQCGVRVEDSGEATPFIRTTNWLKPYDLGVSQNVEVAVCHNPDTGDNVATVVMKRESGDRESWNRCCHAFIGLLRKRFLTWRAVPDDARRELLERGRELLKNG